MGKKEWSRNYTCVIKKLSIPDEKVKSIETQKKRKISRYNRRTPQKKENQRG